jgi:hypothetical protein
LSVLKPNMLLHHEKVSLRGLLLYVTVSEL